MSLIIFKKINIFANPRIRKFMFVFLQLIFYVQYASQRKALEYPSTVSHMIINVVAVELFTISAVLSTCPAPVSTAVASDVIASASFLYVSAAIRTLLCGSRITCQLEKVFLFLLTLLAYKVLRGINVAACAFLLAEWSKLQAFATNCMHKCRIPVVFTTISDMSKSKLLDEVMRRMLPAK